MIIVSKVWFVVTTVLWPFLLVAVPRRSWHSPAGCAGTGTEQIKIIYPKIHVARNYSSITPTKENKTRKKELFDDSF
jgi:hypothetical protein